MASIELGLSQLEVKIRFPDTFTASLQRLEAYISVDSGTTTDMYIELPSVEARGESGANANITLHNVEAYATASVAVYSNTECNLKPLSASFHSGAVCSASLAPLSVDVSTSRVTQAYIYAPLKKVESVVDADVEVVMTMTSTLKKARAVIGIGVAIGDDSSISALINCNLKPIHATINNITICNSVIYGVVPKLSLYTSVLVRPVANIVAELPRIESTILTPLFFPDSDLEFTRSCY